MKFGCFAAYIPFANPEEAALKNKVYTTFCLNSQNFRQSCVSPPPSSSVKYCSSSNIKQTPASLFLPEPISPDRNRCLVYKAALFQGSRYTIRQLKALKKKYVTATPWMKCCAKDSKQATSSNQEGESHFS